MNYWPAEVANLAETTGPLFDLVRMSFENGRRTAREMYGCGGFCFHHNLDAWGDTRRWIMPTAARGPWAARGWPCISGSTTFGQDQEFLAPRGLSGDEGSRAVSGRFPDRGRQGPPGHQPLVFPREQLRMADGTSADLTVAATMDLEIIRVYSMRRASRRREILGVDAAFRSASPAP